MKHLFDPEKLTAYPADMIHLYDVDIRSLTQLTDDEYDEYFAQQAPEGCVLGSHNRKPVWVPIDEQFLYESKIRAIINKRKALYSNVDSLRNEAAMIRLTENDEEKAADYEEQAKALYLKIREENPWPETPEQE